MRLTTPASGFAILAWLTGAAVAQGQDLPWAEWQVPPWGAASRPSGDRPPFSSVPNGRHLAVDCSSNALNAPGALDTDGYDCTSYVGYENYCGCCDDDDFTASRCPACRAVFCGTAVEAKLAMLPNSTEEIRYPRENLVGALPGDIAERFPNLTVLDLTGNRVEGEIPPALWRLPGLRELYLAENSLVGTLPEVTGLRITSLDLKANKLTGSIPEAMGTWTELRYLRISGNRLVGEIPLELWRLPRLSTLLLDGNSLVGTLPDVAGLRITTLGLSGNKLTGSIPEAMGTWMDLRALNLDSNQLSGSIPESLGSWRQLAFLFLGKNKLTGSIPATAGNWSKAELVYLNENEGLGGEIPLAFWRLPRLRVLNLHGNNHVGTLPEVAGLRISQLNLRGNKLTGSIPEAMGTWTDLRLLDLSANQLSGSIPESVGSWQQLVSLVLTDNKLTGHIPEAVGGWLKVQNVLLNGNKLSGPLPNGMANWTQVSQLSLSGNKLNGTLPDEVLGSWHEVQLLHLQSNSFSGPIPRSVASWTKIRDFRCFRNLLSGEIPEEVGNWRQIGSLEMSSNKLTGSLPDSVGNWTSLWKLDLANNSLLVAAWRSLLKLYLLVNGFNGPLPSAIGGWRSLEMLQLGHNEFTGEIPREIIHWSRLQYLDLYGNAFAGELPSEIGNLTALKWVTLARNSLQGQVPDLSRLLQLTNLDVQRNSFHGVGPLPPSLTTFDASRNKLERLPAAVYELPNLEVLSLDDNLITSWPPRGVIKNKISGSQIVCNLKPEEERFVLPKLRFLDVSHNNMTGTSARTFLSSLAYLQNLKVLHCRGCWLGGALHREWASGLADDMEHTGDETCTGLPEQKAGFQGLEDLDLAFNNITELLAAPSLNLLTSDFSSNALEKLDKTWFRLVDNSMTRLLSFKVVGNPSLHLPVQKPTGLCPKYGSTALVADPSTYESAYEEGVECTSLCRGSTAATNEVEGLLNASALCRCQPGFEGHGILCQACPEDTYSAPREGDQYHLVRECKPCPDKSTTGGGNKTTSIAACLCPPGTFLSESAAACVRCPQWPFRTTHAAGERQESACACNASYTGLKEFASKCGCDDGTHMNHKTLSCERCSHSEYCIWATDIARSLQPPVLKPGHWAESVIKLEDFANHSIWRCASKESCGEGGICADGREGLACGLCEAGHHGGPDGPCDPCDERLSLTSRRWSLALGTLVFLVPAIMLLHMGLSTNNDSVQMSLHLEAILGSVKQMVKHIQTISIIGGLSVSWPPVAQAFFEALKRFTVDIPGLLQVGCLSDQTTVAMEMAFKWVMPLAFVAITAVAIPVSHVVSRALLRLAPRIPNCRLKKLLRPEKVAMGAADAVRVLLFTFTIFWATLVANCLQMLTCAPSPNGEYTVETYPQVRCSLKNVEFVALGIVSLLTTVLYLGLPLRFLWQTYMKTTKHLASSERSERGWFHFLFQDFRDGHLAWLVAIMAKDASFVLVPVVLPGQGAAQLLFIAALSAVHVCAVLQSTPFRDRSNSLLEAWNGATGAALCIYSVGMGYEKTAGMAEIEELFQDGVDDSVYRGRAGGMVAVQVVAVGVPVLFLLYQLACAWKKTEGLLPRCLRPVSPEDNQKWLDDFVEETERAPFSSVLKRFDVVDMHHFRSLVEQSSATLGHGLSKSSRSLLVRMHSEIRSSQSTSATTRDTVRDSFWNNEGQDEGQELDPMDEEAVGTAQEEPLPLQGTPKDAALSVEI